MPAHKLHGAVSAMPRPKMRRGRKPRPRAPVAAVSPAAPSPPPPTLHANNPSFAAPPHDDLYVDITAGDYSTTMSVATLHSHPSALVDAYAHDYTCNLRTPEGRVALHLTGDGGCFRFVEAFMMTGRLPPGLGREQLKYLQRSAKPLMMPRLEYELRELYPLREAIRERANAQVVDPCGYIADVLLYAASLVKVEGAHQETLTCLSTLPATLPQPDDLTLAQTAVAEKEVRRSSLLFAYIMLKRMSQPKCLAYFTQLATRSATGFFMHGDLGEQLVRAGLMDLSVLFLQKCRAITPSITQTYQAQNIRTTWLSLGEVSDGILSALRLPHGAAHDSATSCTLGRALALRQSWTEATEVLRNTLTHAVPDELTGSTHQALGNCYLAQNQIQDALHHYHLAYQHAPYDSANCASLGFTLHQLAQYPEASKWRNLLVMLEPQSAEAHLTLGETLSAQGFFQEALNRFGLAETLAGQDIAILQSQITAAERLGDWQRAIVSQRKLIALCIDDAELWRRLAYFYTQDDQPIAAHGATQHFLRLQEAREQNHGGPPLPPTLTASHPATPELVAHRPLPDGAAGAATSDALQPYDCHDYLLFDLPELEPQITGPSEGGWPSV